MRSEVTLTLKTWRLSLLGRRSFSQIKSGGMPQPARWPLLMRAAANTGLEVEHVDEASKAGARASATTMVVTNNTSNRGILSRHLPGSSSTSHPHGNESSHNGRPPGSSNSSSDIHSHSSGDRSISGRPPDPELTGRDHLFVSSSTPEPAGRGHLPNSSTVAEGPTRSFDIIGEAISRTGSRPCVSGAVRRSISPQTAGQLRPHPCHSSVRTRHHRFQELTPRSTTPAPLPPGHRTTAMDIRPLQATGLRRNTPAKYLPRQCHRRPDLSDQLHELHLRRRLPRNPTETSPPGNPTRYGYNTCLQASLRIQISTTGVQKRAV